MMNKNLFQAAWTGNVEHLFKLLEEDPCLLHTVALSGGETPLHIACLAGHLDFTKEVLKLRKEFATELNQDGFTPLHIASASGHLAIVKELLKIDGNLCQIEGEERRIPLHCAVIKGRVDVIKELIACNVDTIASATTAREETALHLAVKYKQFEAFKVLVDYLKQLHKEDSLNVRDGQGNTILHLSVSRKQYHVVDYVLSSNQGGIDVNLLNKRGLTPLDVLYLFQSEAGDREIEDILKKAGAMKAEDLHSLRPNEGCAESTNNQINEQSSTNTNQSRPARVKLYEYFQYNHVKDSPSEARNILLVVVILIATATYQAVLSPPGGVWQEDEPSNSNTTITASNSSNTITTPYKAGHAIMGTKNMGSYMVFIIFNTLGFVTSIHIINILTAKFPLRLELQLSIFALIVTYAVSMAALAPNKFLYDFYLVISLVISLGVPIGIWVIRTILKRTIIQGPRPEQV